MQGALISYGVLDAWFCYGVHALMSLYVYIPLKNDEALIDTVLDFKNLNSLPNCSHFQGFQYISELPALH